MKARAILLALALLAALLLAFWPQPDEEYAVVGAAARSRPPAGPAAGVRFVPLAGDLFPAQTWRPAPPRPRPIAAPAPQPEPPPAPPDFPFDYAGRWTEGSGEVIFLEHGDRLFGVRPGDVVAGAWRLDRMEAAGLVFTYLPLDMEKILRTDR